jgi:hypothetical protein
VDGRGLKGILESFDLQWKFLHPNALRSHSFIPHSLQDEDRLSALHDDILLSILARVNITTAARASVLSTRWKHLPWLLRELTIGVKKILSTPHPNPV